ncbi:FAD-binding protein [Ancylobacter sonchi]|uniref:FAD-binding protein n=1 Tax=Ancylobacter sonchi TaxID=1937790 RepID=UPI001BD6D3E8|nr:FAD-binding protein [Ancylobacter sonchi]MBS7535190.1 FAD-binding protein [Ancylobacter sonchi]
MTAQTGTKLEADVVVMGGGPAGCWAALAAAEQGARVIVVEKGYVGTSGATAAGNTTIIDAAPGSVAQSEAVKRRRARGAGLVEEDVVTRVLDETYRQLGRLADWGYGFPTSDTGLLFRGSMRGVDYLYFMRRKLLKAGVTILDHAPADTLLAHEGVAAGVSGRWRASGERWTVHAGAVVIASGGCAFLSGALGTNNLTGDGYLMAAELGARLSGMDFTGQYGIAPKGSSVTKGIVYFWATLFDVDGNRIEETGDRQEIVARHLLRGSVRAVLDKAPERLREGMRHGQPNIFLPFDRQGIDPFTQPFEVTLLYEGTVRGVGGILIGQDGATDLPGLYAAGDAAAREPMSGATSGGGGPNASWALATGVWAGGAAARFAGSLGPLAVRRPARAATGITGTTVAHADARAELADIIRAVQGEVLPLDRSFYRSGDRLAVSAQRLDTLWQAVRRFDVRLPGQEKSYEAAAMTATARWIVASAQARPESRGIHRREDAASTGEAPRRIHSGGVGRVWSRWSHAADHSTPESLAAE